MKTRNIFIAMILGVAVFSACKKDKDNTTPAPSTPTKTDLITAKNWKLTAFTLNGVNMLSLMEPCEKDNLYKYSKNNTYVQDEGTTKCDPQDPQTVDQGTWKFLANDTKLQMDDDQVSEILELSATTMKLKIIDGDTAIGTFTAQ